MDNWIYNAKASNATAGSSRWLKEETHFREASGAFRRTATARLCYSNNSENLLGDYFSPGLGSTNKNQAPPGRLQ